MNFEEIDDVTTLDAPQYAAFVEWLKQRISAQLRSAKGDSSSIRSAVASYIAFCRQKKLTHGEYTDFFCVDTLSILDLASYSSDEADAVTQLFDTIISPDLTD